MSLKNNIIWNLAGMGMPLLLGLASIPYLYHHLGTEKVGILTLVWALIGYFSLFDFGLGRALTQQLSSQRGSCQQATFLPGLVKGGLLFTAATGILGGLLLAVTAYPLGTIWLNVSPPMQQDTAAGLLIAALGVPMTTVTSGLRGVLEAFEDFATVNILRMLLGIGNFGLPVLSVLIFGPSLLIVIASLIVARFVIMIAHFACAHHCLPRGWQKVALEKKHLRSLFSFGAWMTVTNIVSPLMVTADRFIISGFLGAATVAYYTVPVDMLMRVLVLPAALTAALFPRLASMLINDKATASFLYKRSLLVVTLVLGPICFAIGIGSFWGLKLWMGKEFAEHSWAIVSIMAVGILFNGIAFVPFSAIQAAGRAHTTAKIHLVELAIYIPILIASVHWFGLVGAAFTWVGRVGIDMLILLFFAQHNDRPALESVADIAPSTA